MDAPEEKTITATTTIDPELLAYCEERGIDLAKFVAGYLSAELQKWFLADLKEQERLLIEGGPSPRF